MSQVFDAAGTPASSLASCRTTRFTPTAKNFVDYRGNGTYTSLLRATLRGLQLHRHR